MFRRHSSIKDPTVRVRMFSWSSDEFLEEHCLVYTSRFDPSHSCISHWRANRHKVIFILQDCLCLGNPVRIELEINNERDHRGFFVMRKFEAPRTSGKFLKRTEEPGLFQAWYQDSLRYRVAKLAYAKIARDEGEIRFNTGIRGPGVSYFIHIICHPLKGFDVDLDGPHCNEEDFHYAKGLIGLCAVEHVGGMPPRDVLEKVNVKQISETNKENKSCDIYRASSLALPPPPPPPSTQCSSAIVNAGETRDTFNGATFSDCKFLLTKLARAAEGLSIEELPS